MHIYNRVGPAFPVGAVFTPPPANTEVYQQCLRNCVWSLARVIGSGSDRQLVPGFGGFISATGIKPSRKSTIEYLTPINQNLTEYSVIKEVLKRSEDATKEVGQVYVLMSLTLVAA